MFEDNFIENELIILTKQTMDILLNQDNPAELISVYSFYYYTAKWQKTNRIKCTTSYVAKGLKISEAKVRRAKKQLIELGVIEDAVTKGKNNQITGHYIKMNYIFKKETVEKLQLQSHPNDFPQGGKSHPNDFPQGGENHSMENCNTNALSANNINALSSDSLNSLSSNISNASSDYNAEFEKLWSNYPNKKGKEKALSSYIKARKSGVEYTVIEKGLNDYCMECKLKNREKQYIKNGSTWFNQKCWEDEYDLSTNQKPTSNSNTNQQNNDSGVKFDFSKWTI